MEVPFERSYWVIPTWFLAGAYPGVEHPDEARTRLAAFLDAGIRCIVNLMEEYETDFYGVGSEGYEESMRLLAEEKGLRIECLRMPIPNRSIPTSATMKMILDAIDGAIDQGKPVYAHCLGGLGRTGTVVGCWLIRHGKTNVDDVFSVIRELRKNDPAWFYPSPENERQRWMVKAWKVGQ